MKVIELLEALWNMPRDREVFFDAGQVVYPPVHFVRLDDDGNVMLSDREEAATDAG